MKNLLYIEDESELQRIFKSEVIKGVFNIHSAIDAPSAIKLIGEYNFDIIILDLFYMGKGTAKDIFDILASSDFHIPSEIFILSGYAKELDKITREFSHLLNPNNALLKPEGFFQLIDRLENYS